MEMKIYLTPEQETRLVKAAAAESIDPAEFVKRLVADRLMSHDQEVEHDPMLALFAKWEREDATMTAAEIAEEKEQWETLKGHLNAERDRAGARRVF